MRAAHKTLLDDAFRFKAVTALSLPAWADTYRRLSPMVSAISGKWHTARFEIARGPMMAVTEPGVKTITAKVATQMLKSELMLNIVGYFIHLAPGPILLVQPKDDSAKAFSKERFASMVRATPVLANIFGDKARDKSGESLNYKEFPGGFLALEGAGSPTNLAMRAIRVTLLDEIDKYETTKEGDPVLLAEERTSTYDNSLRVRACSPTHEGESRIDESYKQSDQRKAFVACPHCGHWQHLEFFKTPGAAYVDWSKGEDGEHHTATAALICCACGAAWSEAERLRMMTTAGAIRWHQTRPFTCCGIEQDPVQTRKWEWSDRHQIGYASCVDCGKRAVSNAHAGFTASKLYSPKLTVAALAEQWIASKDDLEARQVFYNTALGQAFTARVGKRVEEHSLASRREKFGDKIDSRIVRLVCGVDTQDDRIEAHVLGVAWPEEFWSIHYEIIPGDLAKPDVWERLYEFLRSTWPHALGINLPISATCMDSGGHFTQQVYDFCRPKARENIWAIKGSSWSRSGDPVWVIPKSRVNRDFGFKPQLINVDAAKDHMRHVLLNEEPGPGYLHMPLERSDAWLSQLTSEQAVFEKKNGVVARRWVPKKGAANEAWDTLIYAYAALCGLKAVRGLNLARDAARAATFAKEAHHE